MKFSEVLATAQSVVGPIEQPPFSNRTWMARETDKRWWLGFSRDGQKWCGTAMDWLLQPILPCSMFSVQYGAQQLHRLGLWTTTPTPGALCIQTYELSRVPSHIGWVWKVLANGNVITYEGNTTEGLAGPQDDGGGFYQRERSTSSILGYGRLLYDSEDEAMTPTVIPAAAHADAQGRFPFYMLTNRSGHWQVVGENGAQIDWGGVHPIVDLPTGMVAPPTGMAEHEGFVVVVAEDGGTFSYPMVLPA